jgi:hypothetical protein
VARGILAGAKSPLMLRQASRLCSTALKRPLLRYLNSFAILLEVLPCGHFQNKCRKYCGVQRMI